MGLPSKLITKLYKVPKFDMAGCYLETVVLIEHQILQTNLHGHASDFFSTKSTQEEVKLCDLS